MKFNSGKINTSTLIIAGIVAALLLVGAFTYYSGSGGGAQNGKYDALAQCLKNKNVVMYGAAWCPHCQNQRAAFGQSFQFVPYVECPDNVSLCQTKGIEGYPTWIFPDGSRLVGEQQLDILASHAGCPAPPNN